LTAKADSRYTFLICYLIHPQIPPQAWEGYGYHE
jgi:hypothetical protein